MKEKRDGRIEDDTQEEVDMNENNNKTFQDTATISGNVLSLVKKYTNEYQSTSKDKRDEMSYGYQSYLKQFIDHSELPVFQNSNTRYEDPIDLRSPISERMHKKMKVEDCSEERKAHDGVIKSTKQESLKETWQAPQFNIGENNTSPVNNLSVNFHENLQRNIDVAKYYSSLANFHLPWNPYPYSVPIVSTGYPANSSSPVLNNNIKKKKSSSTSTTGKCTCDCHNDKDPEPVNVQRDSALLRPFYIPHNSDSLSKENSSNNK